MPRRQRLDAEMVRRGLARSRQQAAEVVAEGRVLVDGRPASKPATQVGLDAAVQVRAGDVGPQWVSRGAHKLLGALAATGVDPTGRRCLDAGASTGGFTQVLLERGAEHVVAVDVGYGQLAWPLRQDERVSVLDRTNVRELRPEQVAPPPSLVVADLSFISLRLVLPALASCCSPGADLLLMVKPQFEVGRNRVGAGGVVREPDLRVEAVLGVARAAEDERLVVLAAAASPLPGPSGNVEYFLHLRPAAAGTGVPVGPAEQQPPAGSASVTGMVRAAVTGSPS